MICPKCNKETNTKKFCTNCGADLEEIIKNQKKEAKEKKGEKFIKVKTKIALVLFLIFALFVAYIVATNIYFSNKNFKNYESNAETTAKISDIKENETPEWELKDIEVTEENKDEDYDGDGLTNQREKELGTNIMNADTDNDGISDGDEVNNCNTNPLKWSTSDDNISDFAKIVKKLDINKKYGEGEIKPEAIEVNSSVTLKPSDLESEIKGIFREFTKDNKINSYKPVFSLYNFEGEVEYKLDDTDVVLLVARNGKYTEFENYTIADRKMTIKIDEDSNSKDFVIVTIQNYKNYQKGGNN